MGINGAGLNWDITPMVFPMQDGSFVSDQALNNSVIRNLADKLKSFDDSFADAYLKIIYVGAMCEVTDVGAPTFEVSLHTPHNRRTRFLLFRFESPNSMLSKTSGSPTSAFRTTPHIIIAYTIDENKEVVARIIITVAEYLEYMTNWLTESAHMGNRSFSIQKPEFDRMITARSYNVPVLFEDSPLSKLMYACLSQLYSIMVNANNRDYDQLSGHIIMEDIPIILKKLFVKKYESMTPLDVRAILKLVS